MPLSAVLGVGRGMLTRDCLSLGCCHKNTLDWVASEHQEFISHSSEGWEVQEEGISIHVLERACFLAHTWPLLLVSSHGREARELSGVFSMGALY